MSDVSKAFYDEVAEIKSMLMRDVGKWPGEADELLNGFLAKHAALLAERIKSQQLPSAVLAFGGVVAESWRDAVNRSADLIYPEGSER
jgi:hypothetical protein